MKKPIVNLDWVAFSVTLLPRVTETSGEEWQFRQPLQGKLIEFGGNNIYRRRLIYYNVEGEKVLTLLCSPYSRVIPWDSCLVEVANKWLYGGSLNWVMTQLNELHPAQFLTLSRVDICGDFQADPAEMEVINMLCGNTAYVQGYREGSLFCDYAEGGANGFRERIPKCMSWGSKRSNIKWKLYNKSLELLEHDEQGREFWSKPYIVQQWEANGLDVHKVWRLEISICPMAKFEWRGERPNLYNLFDPLFIYDIYASNVMKRFQIRANEGHRDKRNDTLLELVDVFSNGRMSQREPQESREVAEFVSGLRAAMKQLSDPSVQCNEKIRAAWVNTARTCVECGHLEAYFQRSFGYPAAEIDTHPYDPKAVL